MHKKAITQVYRWAILSLLVNSLLSETRRFWEGELSFYPELVGLKQVEDIKPNYTELIKGTLIDELDENSANLHFQIIKRGLNKTISTSIIYEFSIPFFVEPSYQNKTLIYSGDNQDKTFQLPEDGLQIYNTDDLRFRGVKLDLNITLKAFKCQAFIGRREVINGREAEVIFDSQYYIFELYYVVDGLLRRLVIHPAKTDDGKPSIISKTTGVVAMLVIGFVAFNTFFWFSLRKAKKIGFFPGTLLYVLLLPLSLLSLLQYYSIPASEIWWVLSSIGGYYVENGPSILESARKIKDKEWKVEYCPFVIVGIICACLTVLVAMVSPISIFGFYLPCFVICLLIDLCCAEEKINKEFAIFMWWTYLLAFLSQVWITVVYALLFHMRHLEIPFFMFWKLIFFDFAFFVICSIMFGLWKLGQQKENRVGSFWV